MELSPSWEANRSSASQEIRCILWNLKVHYRFHKSSPHVPVPSRINPVLAPHPTPYKSILVSSHLRLGLPSGFPNKILYAPFPLRATCPAHFILRDLISLIKFSKEYRESSCSLCSLLHSPVTSPFLDPHICLSTPFSDTLKVRSFLIFRQTTFHTRINKRSYEY